MRGDGLVLRSLHAVDSIKQLARLALTSWPTVMSLLPAICVTLQRSLVDWCSALSADVVVGFFLYNRDRLPPLSLRVR